MQLLPKPKSMRKVSQNNAGDELEISLWKVLRDSNEN